MDDKAIKKHEQRGYGRGYVAGMKRRDREVREMQRQLDSDLTAKRERVFLSILNGLISTPQSWHVGKKQVNDGAGYAKLANTLTDDAMRHL